MQINSRQINKIQISKERKKVRQTAGFVCS